MKSARLIHDVMKPLMTQEFRRFRASLGHMLTTGVATAAVLYLFIYIFSDFIKSRLPGIDSALSASALYYFNSCLILCGSIAVTRWAVSIIDSPHGWISLMKTLGQPPGRLRGLRLTAGILMTAAGVSTWCVALNLMVSPLSATHVMTALASILVAGIYIRSRRGDALTPQTPKKLAHHSCLNSTEPPLLAWRKSRLMASSWTGSSLRVFAAIPILMGTANLSIHGPVMVAQLSCLAGGVILSWTVPFLIAEDLHATWIERQAAVGHDQWIHAWQNIFTSWARAILITTWILFIFGSLVSSPSAAITDSRHILAIMGDATIGGVLAAFPVWIAPAFIMQIDGRRTLTNMVVLTLIGIFAGTAIMAIPYLIPGLYLLSREAHRYQGGRFARGSYN